MEDVCLVRRQGRRKRLLCFSIVEFGDVHALFEVTCLYIVSISAIVLSVGVVIQYILRDSQDRVFLHASQPILDSGMESEPVFLFLCLSMIQTSVIGQVAFSSTGDAKNCLD